MDLHEELMKRSVFHVEKLAKQEIRPFSKHDIEKEIITALVVESSVQGKIRIWRDRSRETLSDAYLQAKLIKTITASFPTLKVMWHDSDVLEYWLYNHIHVENSHEFH